MFEYPSIPNLTNIFTSKPQIKKSKWHRIHSWIYDVFTGIHKNLFIRFGINLAILLLGAIPAVSYGELVDFLKNEVSYVWENDPNCIAAKKVFLDAFEKSYSQIPLEVLRKSSKEELVQWLDDAFEEMCAEFKNGKNTLWFSAFAEERLAGFLVIDIAPYPEEIYLAQLAIDPAYQRRGIAATMIRSVMDQFSECGKFVVITRRANKEAMGLYNTLGFTPSTYMHEGYSPELYAGFEYIPPKKE